MSKVAKPHLPHEQPVSDSGHRLDVTVFGEAMLLLMADRPGPIEHAHSYVKHTAGAETNVAIGLARLGLRVGWASRLGSDSMARFLLASLKKEGVDCSQVVCDPAQRTGFMFKSRVTDGSDPQIEYHRSGSAASRMGPADVDEDWLSAARHLHATGVFAALSPTTLAAAHKSIDVMHTAGGTVSFDPNLRPALWASAQHMRDEINRLAARADWVMPGLEEGRLLTGLVSPQAIARHYRDAGAQLVVIKLGPDGAYFDGRGEAGHVPAAPVSKVIDTVGAGDGFAVGLISALLEAKTLTQAVERGAWIGARAVEARGDTEGLPTRVALQAAGR
jgi:2-dehydro-3-deoxygluconokinase